MRKIFKKAIATIAAAAMLIGTVATMPAEEAKAATDVKLYFKISDPESYGCNVWGGAQAKGGDPVSTWTDGDQKHPSLIESNEYEGWGYITIDDTSKVEGLQVVKSNNPLRNESNGDNLWNSAIKIKNLTEAYFDAVSGKWYKEATLENEIPMPTLDNIFYVVGQEALTGKEWDLTNQAGKMTEVSSGVFEVTFKNIPAREGDAYEFKVFQDPDDFAWEKVIWNDAYKKNDNMGIEIKEKSDVTFKVTVSGSNISLASVTVTKAVEGPSSEPESESQTPTTVAKKEIAVRVKLDSSLAWETVKLHVWEEGGAPIGEWPGNAMTKDGEYYTVKLEVSADAQINMIVNNGSDKKTDNIMNVDLSTGSVEIAVASDLKATVTPVTGDSTPYMAVIASMIALGCVVVVMNTKKANR